MSELDKLIIEKRNQFERKIAEADSGRKLYEKIKSSLYIEDSDHIFIIDPSCEMLFDKIETWLKDFSKKTGSNRIVIISGSDVHSDRFRNCTLNYSELNEIIMYYRFCEFHPHVHVACFDEVFGEKEIFDRGNIIENLFSRVR